MKRYWLLLLMVALAKPAYEQGAGYTQVTGTKFCYQNGSVTAAFQNQSGGSNLPLLNGSVFPQTNVTTFNSNGVFSFYLADNNQIFPTPSQWQITVCAKSAGQPPCGAVTVTVTGPTTDISSQITSLSCGSGGGGVTPGTGGTVPVYQQPGGNTLISSNMTVDSTGNNFYVPGNFDQTIVNPVRNSSLTTNVITGNFTSYLLTGTIPGTSPYNFGQLGHIQTAPSFLDTTPGCWGFQGTCYNTQHGFMSPKVFVNGGGGTNVFGQTSNYFSVGDHIGYENYINSFGGSIDSGGPEGTKGVGMYVTEPADTWTGAVAAGHGGAGQNTLTVSCATDCGSGTYGIVTLPGNPNSGAPASLGQGMWITDEQTINSSGQIQSVTNYSGNTPGTITVNITSGISNLAVSTCSATLSTTLSPVANPSGSGTQSLTFTVTDVTGTCTSGGLMQFSGTNHEQAIIASVTAPSGGQQIITANIAKYHPSGTYIFENASSDAGLMGEIVANNTSGLSFPFEVLGVQSITGNTAVMWWQYWYAGQAAGSNFPFGRMLLTQLSPTNLSNTGGTVTITGGNLNQNAPWINNQTAIYISNASNSAFDGPCTNTSINFSTNQLTCTQGASTGQTATSATLTLTDATQDNPYGNSRVNFYQGAAIVDAQDYAATPIMVNGINNYPVDGLGFNVEPNKMPLNAGDALVEHHSAGQYHNYTGLLTLQNPIGYSNSGISIGMKGVYGTGAGSILNNYAFSGTNQTDNSQYSYYGGSMTPTPFMVEAGMFADTLYLRQPPGFSNYVIDSPNCPPAPSSCTDAGFWYGLYNFAGASGVNQAKYYPSTNMMQWTGPQQFNSPGGNIAFYVGGLGTTSPLGIIFGGRSNSFLTPTVPLWNTAAPTVNDLLKVTQCNTAAQCGIADAGVAAGNIPVVASLTTTSATSDSVTLTGMTATGHCAEPGATNATAATNIATTYISAKAANQITVTHTAVAGMTYDIVCTPN